MTVSLQIAALLLLLPLFLLVRKKNQILLRWNTLSRQQSRSLQSVEHLRLSPHHSLHLIRVEGKTMLVAVDPSGCRLLESEPGGLSARKIGVHGQGA